ncbi:ANTAR domain-containing protein [Streptomyces sp. NPDC047017]|uniref:ANTAR domain-containing protein n=1 Tax=Streptomyces sp. NPDC047017 TaxID=3155024 RepID=UPI00340BCDA1
MTSAAPPPVARRPHTPDAPPVSGPGAGPTGPGTATTGTGTPANGIGTPATGAEVLAIAVRTHPDGRIALTPRGELVFGCAGVLTTTLAGLPPGSGPVQLDMVSVTFMDSAGLEFLGVLHEYGRTHRVRVSATGWTGQPRRVLELAGLNATDPLRLTTDPLRPTADPLRAATDPLRPTADPLRAVSGPQGPAAAAPGTTTGLPGSATLPPGATPAPGTAVAPAASSAPPPLRIPSAVAAERAERLLQLQQEVAQLRHALASRPVIDQARGILMAAHACTAQRAWDILRETSQRTNTKLRTVAEAITAGARPDGPAVPRELRAALRAAVVRTARTSADRGSAGYPGGE